MKNIRWNPRFALLAAAVALLGATASAQTSSSAADAQAVAALDTRYQAAVAKNDAATMDRILADDFVLVTGRGKVFTRTDLLNEARAGKTVYEKQEEIEQKVRVWGDTAVVTALLWVKGAGEDKKPFDYKLWSAIPTCGHRPAGATCP